MLKYGGMIMNKKKFLYLIINIAFAVLVMLFDYLFLSSYLAKNEKSIYVTYKIIASAGFVLMNAFNIIYAKLAFNKKYNHWFIYFLLAAQVVVFIADIVLEYNFMLGAIVFACGHLVFLSSFFILEKIKVRDIIFMFYVIYPLFISISNSRRFKCN